MPARSRLLFTALAFAFAYSASAQNYPVTRTVGQKLIEYPGQHRAGELFNVMAGIRMIPIPHAGTAPDEPGQFIRLDDERWAKVFKSANFKLN